MSESNIKTSSLPSPPTKEEQLAPMLVQLNKMDAEYEITAGCVTYARRRKRL